MHKIKEFLKVNIKEISIFFTYMFSFLLVEQIINNNIYDKLGEEYVVPIYALCILFTAIGYISLSIFNRTKIKLKTTRIIIELVFVLSMFLNIILKNGYIYILLSAISTFTFGYIGAYVYFRLSQRLSQKQNMGKIIGTGISIALLMQIPVYNLIKNKYLLLGFIYISSIILFVLINKKENIEKISEKYTTTISKSNKIIPILIVSIISVIISIQDGAITYIDSLGYINVYGIPRLFYIIGVLVAGYIADVKEGKYLGLTTVCVVLISICGILFLKDEKLYNLNISAIFLLGGFYVIYLTTKFINIAPHTKTPELWAGMGRIVRSITTSIVVIPSEVLFKTIGYDWITAISTIFVIGLLLVFYKELSSFFAVEQNKNTSRNIEEFINQFAFTPREKEVCLFILKENKITKEIADELNISERTVQRHLTNIYSKTNTKSRNELYNLFYKI